MGKDPLWGTYCGVSTALVIGDWGESVDAEEETGEILSLPPGERGMERLWVTYPPAAAPRRETQVWLSSQRWAPGGPQV